MNTDTILLLVIFCALFALIFFITTKTKVNGSAFDERQTIARASAFKYSFIGLLLYFVASELVSIILEHNWCTHETNLGLGMLCSATIFGGICIMKDAYVAPNGNASYTFISLAFLSILNIAVGVWDLVDDGVHIMKGNEVDICLNLLIGVVFIILLICKLIKCSIERKERN